MADVRFAMSALDLSNVDFAINDEIMVHGESGKIYYKRPDGQVVSFRDIDLRASDVTRMVQTCGVNKDLFFRESNDTLMYRALGFTKEVPLNLKRIGGSKVIPVATNPGVSSINIESYPNALILNPRGSDDLALAKYGITPLSWEVEVVINFLPITMGNPAIMVTSKAPLLGAFNVLDYAVSLSDADKASLSTDRYRISIQTITVRSADTAEIPTNLIQGNEEIYMTGFDIITSTRDSVGELLDVTNSNNRFILKLDLESYTQNEVLAGELAPKVYDSNFDTIPTENLMPGYYITLDGVFYVDKDGNVTNIAGSTSNDIPRMLTPTLYESSIYTLDDIKTFLG